MQELEVRLRSRRELRRDELRRRITPVPPRSDRDDARPPLAVAAKASLRNRAPTSCTSRSTSWILGKFFEIVRGDRVTRNHNWTPSIVDAVAKCRLDGTVIDAKRHDLDAVGERRRVDHFLEIDRRASPSVRLRVAMFRPTRVFPALGTPVTNTMDFLRSALEHQGLLATRTHGFGTDSVASLMAQ